VRLGMVSTDMKIDIPSHLSDTELVAAVKSLAGREREATAHLIAHLAELDRRQLYLGAGFPSMFAYCTEALSLSEPAAYNRIEVARAARTFPAILEMLSDGRLSLATVRVLASHLTADNHKELLVGASGKSRRRVEELVARHFPQADVASSIRKLPATAGTVSPASEAAATAASREERLSTPAAPPAPAGRPVIMPLAPERYQIRFTASAATCEKLRLAQDMLRHAVPTGDTAEIIDRALTVLLAELARKKFAATARPHASRGTMPGSRDIAARVRRAVWIRDGGRCAFVSKSARRCNTRAFLEFHHVDPHGVGGEATVENIELRCRAHNNYEAECFYGPGTTRRRTTRPGTSWGAGTAWGMSPRPEPTPDGCCRTAMESRILPDPPRA
jgi:hypothetical protein